MRWTIPTLIQQLIDQGMPVKDATAVVIATYPDTRGDTFYRWTDPTDAGRVAVGVYGLWNDLRGDQPLLGATPVSGDARTITQFYRLNRRDPLKSVKVSDRPDVVIARVAAEAANIIRDGGYFSPTQADEDDPTITFGSELAASIRKVQGAADYIRSIDFPSRGG